MTNARLVETFIEETLARTDVPGRLRKLVVRHLIKGNTLGDEIRAVSVPETPDEDWRTAMALKIAEQAASESVALSSGIQRYAIQALFEGDDKPHGRTIITAEGSSNDEDALDTEGPDAEGVLVQSMAQTRFFAAASFRTSGQQIAYYERTVDKLTKENETLRSERHKMLSKWEELMTARHERELEIIRETSKAKAFEQTADKLGLLIPVAINHIAGRKLLPESAPERLLVQAFAQRLTPQKLQMLAASGAFDEGELVAFMTILKSLAGSDLAPSPAPAAATETANGVAS
jgi:hypothetical protein